MSMLAFRGGPWDGFVIEYGERVQPDESLQPSVAVPPDGGRYFLNEGRNAYLWADGIRGRDTR